MKLNKWTLGLAAIGAAFLITSANAQTNAPTVMPPFTSTLTSDPTISGGLQEIYNAALGSTNFAVALGGGRSLKGGNTLLFADYIYNFNNNVGLVLGYDYLRSSTPLVDVKAKTASIISQANFVKGGLNVKATIQPLKSLLPNFYVTPFASILITTRSGAVGQIIVAGADWESPLFWGIRAHIGGGYESRSGGNGDPFNGGYAFGHIAISKGF